MKNRIVWRRIWLGCLAGLLGVLSGCSSIVRAAYLEFLPLQGFETLQTTDGRVHYEPEMKSSAEMLAARYLETIRQIETKLGDKLHTTPEVYLCASDACFVKYAFNKEGRAEARWRGNLILLNAKTLEAESRLLSVFSHELVHAFWFQRDIGCTPAWWREGLAVESSNGGGAELVMRSMALQAVRQGQVFQASNENGCWTRMPPGLNGMGWPMFYRQSGMFVEWLRVSDPKAFSAVLEKQRTGDSLWTSIASAYGQSVNSLHLSWQKSVQ